jgi:hypothetical protein
VLEVLEELRALRTDRALILAFVKDDFPLRLPPHHLADLHPGVDPKRVDRVELERPLADEPDIAE